MVLVARNSETSTACIYNLTSLLSNMSSLDPDLRLFPFVLYRVGVGIRALSPTAEGQGECRLMKVTHSEWGKTLIIWRSMNPVL